MARLCVLAALLAAVPLSAHHSFSAYYFEEQSVTHEGVVQEFQYRSPHAVLVFGVRETSGQVRSYAAEWSNPNRLTRDGITRDTLKPGDLVIVRGSPGRNPSEYKLHLKGIRRTSDGWSWGR
jgi:hypothetical protein